MIGDRFWTNELNGEFGRYGWDRTLTSREQTRLPRRIEELREHIGNTIGKLRVALIAGAVLGDATAVEFYLDAPTEVIAGTATGALAAIGYGVVKAGSAMLDAYKLNVVEEELNWLNTKFPVHWAYGGGGQRNQ